MDVAFRGVWLALAPGVGVGLPEFFPGPAPQADGHHAPVQFVEAGLAVDQGHQGFVTGGVTEVPLPLALGALLAKQHVPVPQVGGGASLGFAPGPAA